MRSNLATLPEARESFNITFFLLFICFYCKLTIFKYGPLSYLFSELNNSQQENKNACSDIQA